jgi:hypothetical protein
MATTKASRLRKTRIIDPIPLRPPGYFAQSYTAEVVREENRLAKSSIIRRPNGLE